MTKPRTLRLDGFLPYRLSIATNMVSDIIARAYRTMFGLNIPEWRLLAVLAESEGITQLELSLATRMDKVTVSRAAAGLVERKLALRTPNAADKRSHLLSLTEQGRDLYRQVAPKALALEDAVLVDFDKAEVAQLMAMLERLEEAAQRLGP